MYSFLAHARSQPLHPGPQMLSSLLFRIGFAGSWLVTFLFAGCATTPAHLKPEELSAVITEARIKAIRSGFLSETEMDVVEQMQPVVAYYFTARPVARYSVSWTLSGNEELVVSGQGDLFTLAGATVVRRPRAP